MGLLERQLSLELLERAGNGVRMTEAGHRYYDGVVAALGLLRSAREEATDLAHGAAVVIACSHDCSHLLIMPRFGDLEALLGPEAKIRLLTFQRHIKELQPIEVADIVLSWHASDARPADRVVFLREEVQPVCAPDYLRTRASMLQGPVKDWVDVRLVDLRSPNKGWATWQSLFAIVGHPEKTLPFEIYDTYTQTLDAAVAGRGIALGWKYFVDAHLKSGALVPLFGEFNSLGGCYVAGLTAKGRRNVLARRCLDFFKYFV